jgi:predicted porin
MTRTLAALAAALIATGARAQTPPAATPPSDAPAAAPAAPAAPAPAATPAPAPAPAPVAAAPAKPAEKKLTYVIGQKSQISIAGRAWVEFNNVRTGDGYAKNNLVAPTAKKITGLQNLSRISSNSSYLRVEGQREFAPGWKAIAQIEAEAGFDGESGTPFGSTRNTFAGIDTPFGSLIGGKFDSPAKETTIGRDPFGGTGIFGYYNVFTGYRADRRLNNQVMYESPSIEGFSLLASFSLGEAKFAKTATDYKYNVGFDATSATTVQATYTVSGTGPRVDPYVASGAVHYRNKTPYGPLFVGVAYEYRNDCGAPDNEAPGGPSCDRAQLGTDKAPNGTDTVLRFGADYAYQPTRTKIAVVYDRIDAERPEKYGVKKASLSRDAYWASITQGILSNKDQVILNYGFAGKYSGTPTSTTTTYEKTGVQTFTVAYRHNFDADFHFYLAYAQIMNERNQNQKFGSGSPPASDANGWKSGVPYGSTVSAFGAGLRYNF